MVVLGIGLFTALVFVSLSAVHIYWALGGKGGFKVAVPEVEGHPDMAPPAPVMAIVAIACLVGAGLVIADLGYFDTIYPLSLIPTWLLKGLTILFAAVFFLRAVGDFQLTGFFKKVRHTTFAIWDTRFYIPVCLFLGACCLLLASQAV